MKSIFSQSYWFWVISKIILAVLMLISTLSILATERLKSDEVTANLIGLLVALIILVTLINDFSVDDKMKVLKIISGVLLILSGSALFIILLTVSEGGRSAVYFLGFPFAIWFILIGIFDILRLSHPKKG